MTVHIHKIDCKPKYNYCIFQNVDPTPRTDRISKDYEKEYPSIEIEGRRTIHRSTDKHISKKNIENVKLEIQTPWDILTSAKTGANVEDLFLELAKEFVV